MEGICADGSCMMSAAMQQPVNKAMIQSVESTMKAEKSLLEANVTAQAGQAGSSVKEDGVGSLLNVWG